MFELFAFASIGAIVGFADVVIGFCDGMLVGSSLGCLVGVEVDGVLVGIEVVSLGANDGLLVGYSVGGKDGKRVGDTVG